MKNIFLRNQGSFNKRINSKIERMSKLVQAIHCVKAIESGAIECQLQNDKLIKIEIQVIK